MCSKLLLASATIGLLLAGPQNASAQVLNACVSSIGNIVIVASATAPCPPSAGGPTWTKTTLSQTPGTPGAIAARQYSCPTQLVASGNNVTFTDSGIGFGTTLPTPIGNFTNFVLQPGTYQVHFSISLFAVSNNSTVTFGSSSAVWFLQSLLNPAPPLSGDRLLSVTAPNTTEALQYSGLLNTPLSITGSPCVLILTQLQ
jgi:hypothetical protein